MNVARYTNVDTFKIEAEFITPALIHGADTSKIELRSAPIKAALRYWWRVLYGSAYLFPANNPEKLFERESEIFGSTKGASRVKLFLLSNQTQLKDQPVGDFLALGKNIEAVHAHNRQINILQYLSYGTQRQNDGTARALTTDSPFTFQLHVDKKYSDQVFAALYALSCFGGLGGKARNGFGSFHIISCDKNGTDKVKLDKDLLCGIPNWLRHDPAPFPVLNHESHIFQTKRKFTSVADALSEVGDSYYHARMNLENAHSYLKRFEVSRPIVQATTMNPRLYPRERRTKPFHLKVIKENKSYIGQILVLPTCYSQEGNCQDYLQAVHDMTEYFRKNMIDVTDRILPMQGNNNGA